jgi:alpha-D-ribose 1-methylphosphonate 5-triphosphate synthase subunit PhnL
LELVAEPLLTKGHDWDEAKKEARDWLDAFSLKPDIWHAYPTTFSGGEQQKVNLARALISPRRLLLLDEPTASLDVQTRAALVERLGQLKEQGIAMIGVFHQPEEVMPLVDRTVRLEPTNGKVRATEKELAYVVE